MAIVFIDEIFLRRNAHMARIMREWKGRCARKGLYVLSYLLRVVAFVKSGNQTHSPLCTRRRPNREELKNGCGAPSRWCGIVTKSWWLFLRPETKYSFYKYNFINIFHHPDTIFRLFENRKYFPLKGTTDVETSILIHDKLSNYRLLKASWSTSSFQGNFTKTEPTIMYYLIIII